MVAVTRPGLVTDHRDQVHVKGGGLVEDVVERFPVNLTSADVRRQCSLECPETHHRIWAERAEERIDLSGAGHAAAAGVDSDLSGQLIGVEAGELGRHATDV